MGIFKNDLAVLSSGVALCALLCAPAVAQTGSTAASAQATPQDSSGIADIIVTAQFRNQNLQDTPLAISAVTGAMLESRSQTSVSDVAGRAPSVTIEKSSNGGGIAPQLTIRGIGQTDFYPAVEPGVGVYVDDVYYGLMIGSTFELLDLDRVEILRGPQGTLSGKNSVGGSIKLFSKVPTNEPGGYAKLSYGRFDLMEARGSINVPVINDRLMVRISGLVRNQSGWFKRLDYGCVNPGTLPVLTGAGVSDCKLGEEGGQNLSALRASARIIWSDNIEQTITGDVVRDHQDTSPAKQLSQGPWAAGYNFITPAKSYTSYTAFLGKAYTAGQFSFRDKNTADQWGVSNIFDITLSDHLTFKSITAYRETKAGMTQQGSLAPFDTYTQQYDVAHKQFSQEIRLSGTVGKWLDWTVGGFYYDASQHFDGRLLLDGGFTPGGGSNPAGGGLGIDFLEQDKITSSTKALFSNTTFHITDALNLTGGLRYTKESKDYAFGRASPDGGPLDPTQLDLVGLSRSYAGDNWDFRVAMDYRWSNSLLTYAQFSTGFKGGGVNPRTFFASQAVLFSPEKVKSYELGLKSDLFDRRVRFNAAAFYTRYKGMQLLATSCDELSYLTLPDGSKFFIPNAPCTMTRNAGDSKLWGAEFETQIELIDGLTVDASGSLLDFKYTKVDPATRISIDADFPFLAKKKLAIGVQYALPALGGTITPRLDFDYRSGFETEPAKTNTNFGTVSGRYLFNARIAYQTDDKNWELALAVTNLANKFYYANKFDRTGPPFFSAQGFPGRPREWNLSLKRNF